MTDSPVAVITGASSGIGLETALAFARKGYSVVGAARGVDRLAEGMRRCEQAGIEALAVPTDVSEGGQVRSLVDGAMDRFGRIDVMVNNAGYGVHARVHETSVEQMRQIFETNFFGVFYGCLAVAPVMIRQRRGHIFNVSSVIGKRGAPFNGAYCATKFAVCGLTDSLRVEMMPYDVRVTSVCPTLTETEFFENVQGGTARKRSSFARVRGLMPPSIVGRKIAATAGKSKPELVFSPGGRFLVWVSALWPRLADRLMKVYHDDLVRHP